jgi:hypothetical protein
MVADRVLVKTEKNIVPPVAELLNPVVHELHHFPLNFRVWVVEIGVKADTISHYFPLQSAR